MTTVTGTVAMEDDGHEARLMRDLVVYMDRCHGRRLARDSPDAGPGTVAMEDDWHEARLMRDLVVYMFVYTFCLSPRDRCHGGRWARGSVAMEDDGHEVRLMRDLFADYNSFPRPVSNTTHIVYVKFGISLSQIVGLNMKDQVMTTSVWLKQIWEDYKLKWDPAEYDGITRIKVPVDMIWIPDVLLYNNADGKFEVSPFTKATLFYNGMVVWTPAGIYNADGKFEVSSFTKATLFYNGTVVWTPAGIYNADGKFEVSSFTKATLFYNGTVVWTPAGIYKSYCYIDVTFFPFDRQNCSMKFGTWTYDATVVDMIPIEPEVDLTNFLENGEFVIMSAPLYRHVLSYECCPPYVDITAYIVLERLPLYFTVNLLIPCLLFTFLSLLVFYLPSKACEKITLCISILLSLAVFLLVVVKIIPSTSLAVPLLGKYLLLTTVCVILSVVVTTVVLSVSDRTDPMPGWVRKVLLQVLPRLLCMTRPGSSKVTEMLLNSQADVLDELPEGETVYASIRPRGSPRLTRNLRREEHYTPPELRAAVENINAIAKSLRGDMLNSSLSDDWQYAALVLDRFFMWFFFLVSMIGSLLIFLPPFVTDRSVVISY
ncbi:CHRNA3 [Branchiostoma lanceolatum]|uniref:CHRNA3 protein n=1 Tax=Branchiostoma lanceolatum TaxID=7740 RepID=A0A8J9W2M2_BRALA|nr:CHRNA3 [Branchiostoma lanceolatum]